MGILEKVSRYLGQVSDHSYNIKKKKKKKLIVYKNEGFPGGSLLKNMPTNADASSIPGLGRSFGGGNGNPLQYSCLGNPWTVNLEGYSPWDLKESDTIEGLSMRAHT